MAVAFFVGRYHELDTGTQLDWDSIIRSGLFDLLRRITLSDIKAPVHRRIRSRYPEHLAELDAWAVEQWESLADDPEFIAEFRAWVAHQDQDSPEDRVLVASHKLSTFQEVKLIRQVNPPAPELDRIEAGLRTALSPYVDLRGVREVLLQQNLGGLVNQLERLRFQVRWSHTPRVPATSVLGHTMTVAAFAWFFSRSVGACPRRRFNNFFCGLFHDLPEAVTRDIVSPVKRATPSFPQIVKQVEEEVVGEELMPLIDPRLHQQIHFYIDDEFASRILVDGERRTVSSAEIGESWNEDRFDPIDGELIRAADDFSAYLEASQSIRYGIRSHFLQGGVDRIRSEYRDAVIAGLPVGELIASVPTGTEET